MQIRKHTDTHIKSMIVGLAAEHWLQFYDIINYMNKQSIYRSSRRDCIGHYIDDEVITERAGDRDTV